MHACVWLPRRLLRGNSFRVTLVQVRGDGRGGVSCYCSRALPEDGVLPQGRGVGGAWPWIWQAEAQEVGGMAAARPLAAGSQGPRSLPAGRGTDPVWVEGQAADGADALAHEAVVVLDAVDELPGPAVDGGELVHGAAAGAEGGRQRLRQGWGREGGVCRDGPACGGGGGRGGRRAAGLGTYQAMRLAWGWMSRAVSPFTICSTLTDSGIRGSKKRTSPFTLPRGFAVRGGEASPPAS